MQFKIFNKTFSKLPGSHPYIFIIYNTKNLSVLDCCQPFFAGLRSPLSQGGAATQHASSGEIDPRPWPSLDGKGLHELCLRVPYTD